MEYKSTKDLFTLKTEAHALIDDLVGLGLTKDFIYKGLQNNLHCTEAESHIGSMVAITQVQKAIHILFIAKKFQQSKRVRENREIKRSENKIHRALKRHEREKNEAERIARGDFTEKEIKRSYKKKTVYSLMSRDSLSVILKDLNSDMVTTA